MEHVDSAGAVEPSAPPGQGAYWPEARRGFAAALPLWLGICPFAVAFALLARAAGLSVAQTMAFSLILYGGASQIVAVTMLMSGVAGALIVLTAALLNLRHLLYGLSLGRLLGRRPRTPRPLLAYLLTDEAYGLTLPAALAGRGGDAFLLGSGLSLHIAWNGASLVGALLGGVLPDPETIGLDFIFPLTFLALLTPLMRTRRQLAVALVAAGLTLLLNRLAPGGLTVLLAAVPAAALGVLLDRRWERGR